LRSAIDVCPGAPACRNATTETRRDAQRLVDALGRWIDVGTSLHVSGCEKGCARRGAANLTFVGRNGRYDIIRDDGSDGLVAVSSVMPEELAKAVERLMMETAP
jgi:precorrin-3B synthase